MQAQQMENLKLKKQVQTNKNQSKIYKKKIALIQLHDTAFHFVSFIRLFLTLFSFFFLYF